MNEPEKRVKGPEMTASLPVGSVEDEGAMFSAEAAVVRRH